MVWSEASEGDERPGEPRTALVTGASAGLGRGIAVAFGALGWRVAVGARREDRLAETAEQVEAAGGRVFAHRLDVTDADSVRACFDASERALGTVEVLVANAGIAVPGPLADLDPADIQRVFDTNVVGAALCAREAVRRWRAAGIENGDLVFISSETAERPWPHNVAYSASKVALEHVARGLRMELDGTGARVSIVQLGPAESEFGFGFPPERMAEALAAWQEARVWTHWAMMTPEQVARAVVFATTAPRGLEVHDVVVKPTRPRETTPTPSS